LVLAVIALFTVVPRRERAFVGPILPIYFLYVLAHIVPITVGFGNWVALRLWGRRIYRDHYQVREDDPTVPLPRLKLRPNGARAAAPVQRWRGSPPGARAGRRRATAGDRCRRRTR